MSASPAPRRTAVITGASRGIGAGLAGELGRRGLNLGLCARSMDEGESSGTVVAHALDVTDARALEEFASELEQRFGRIDLWVNNAAVIEPLAHLREADTDLLDTHFRVNVLGVALGSQVYARHSRRHGGGVLINVSSGAATRALPGAGAYCASKAAVNMLTEVIQLEEADAGLRAFALSPGVVDTAMPERIRAQALDRFPWARSHHEIKRTGRFTQIATIAEFILSLAFDPPGADPRVVVRVPDGRG